MDSGAVHQCEAQGVGAEPVDQDHGIGEVALALGHLLSVLCQDDSVGDVVHECRLVEQGRRHDCQCVEPSAGLVQAFGDEVGRERACKALLVLERIMKLSVGHASAFEPAVQDIGHPSHGSLSVRAGPGQFVDIVLVQVGDFLSALLLKLFDGADDFDVVRAVALPYGNGVAPEAVAGDGPVAGSL